MVNAIDRREAVAALLEARGDALIVTGLGSPTYDVHAAGDRDANYYLWGAMGGAALVGLGVAQAQPDRPVWVVTGDGEQLMAMGALATIGVAAPANLSVIVLDNQHFGETGMQGSHTGAGVSLAGVASSCGWAEAREIAGEAKIPALAEELTRTAAGPRLYVLKVKSENLPRSMPSRDAVFIKNRFRGHLGFDPN
ncbi:MAG: thiamine pyrophosphate-dependent enzyme [Pseudomonadota bacterium]